MFSGTCRQTAQLLIEQCVNLPAIIVIKRSSWHFSRLPFSCPSLLNYLPRLERRLASHALQETADGLALTDARCLAHEHEKRRLKGIFGIVSILQNATADLSHHRPMSPHQSLEGSLITRGEETV